MLDPGSVVRDEYASLIERTAIPEEVVLKESLGWLEFINLQRSE